MKKRSAFFISDGTAITVESLGNSLLAQFSDSIVFEKRTVRFIKDGNNLAATCADIERSYADSGEPPLIFETIVDPEVRKQIAQTPGIMFDVFGKFLAPLEAALGTQSNHSTGSNRVATDSGEYHNRIEAINYTLAHDDGIGTKNYARADIVLLGVSRSGKTPTSLYLAMQFSVFCANYPFTEDDNLDSGRLPAALALWPQKLFGLTINPEHLHTIRERRRPGSNYSSLANCRYEVQAVENIMRQHSIPYLDATQLSVEELASRIVKHFHLS